MYRRRLGVAPTVVAGVAQKGRCRRVDRFIEAFLGQTADGAAVPIEGVENGAGRRHCYNTKQNHWFTTNKIFYSCEKTLSSRIERRAEDVVYSCEKTLSTRVRKRIAAIVFKNLR